MAILTMIGMLIINISTIHVLYILCCKSKAKISPKRFDKYMERILFILFIVVFVTCYILSYHYINYVNPEALHSTSISKTRGMAALVVSAIVLVFQVVINVFYSKRYKKWYKDKYKK